MRKGCHRCFLIYFFGGQESSLIWMSIYLLLFFCRKRFSKLFNVICAAQIILDTQAVLLPAPFCEPTTYRTRSYTCTHNLPFVLSLQAVSGS